MRTILTLLLLAAPAFADPIADARARAALSLALANTVPVKAVVQALTYGDAHAAALAQHKPLVAFVNQTSHDITDCITCAHSEPTLPPQVWVGIVGTDGSMYRVVLSGSPTESDILAAAHKLDKSLHVPPQAAANPGWSNVGDCRCQRTTGRCTCIPASKCPNGCPAAPTAATPTPQYQPQYTLPTPMTYRFTPSLQNCPT